MAVDVAQALGGKRRGNGFRCRCPAHDDGDPSLDVDNGEKGVVLKCRAGCSQKDVLAAVAKIMGRPLFNGEAKASPKTIRTTRYDYRDPASGEVRYHKKRFDRDDGSKFCPFYPKDRGGSPTLLYGAERLADLGEGAPVWIVEGEKCVDRLAELGAVAVSGDTGHASKWLPEHAALLRGLRVILWPDSDAPGETYISNAAVAIRAVDQGADIRVTRPFGPPDGAKARDVFDWDGDLAELAAGAVPYAPLPGAMAPYDGTDGEAEIFLLGHDYEAPGLPAPNPITLLSYAEMVSLPPTDWLIEGLVPCRSKSVLFGQSDSFKSFIAVDMAGHVEAGRSYHGNPVKRCKAIYVASEGAIGVGRKRNPAWMAAYDIPIEDRQNIFLVKAETILPNDESRSNLIKAIRTIVEPCEDFFIIIDVLRGTMTGSESDDEAAHAWTRAAEILVAEGGTLLTVTHSPYSTDDRIRGSSHLWGSFDTRLHAEGDKEAMTAVLKVNRHKDHDSTGQWGFKLDVVDIPEHPGETSLVPRLDGEVKSKGNGKKAADGEIISAEYLTAYERKGGARGTAKKPSGWTSSLSSRFRSMQSGTT